MGVISGSNMVIDGQSTMGSWSIDHTADVQAIIASNTFGAPKRIIGNYNWTGSVEGWGHTPAVLPGDSFTFKGSIDESLGASGAAIVDSTSITINVESGEVIKFSTSFSSNGLLTLGAAVVAADTDCPTAFTPIGVTVEYDDLDNPSVSYTTLANVKTITINLTADNQSYIDTSTAGQTQRLAGNIDCTVDIDVNVEDTGLASLPEVNTATRLKITLDGVATPYQFDYIRWASVGGITVSRETAGVLSATLNGQFSGVEEVTDATDTCSVGEITLPDRAYWPS